MNTGTGLMNQALRSPHCQYVLRALASTLAVKSGNFFGNSLTWLFVFVFVAKAEEKLESEQRKNAEARKYWHEKRDQEQVRTTKLSLTHSLTLILPLFLSLSLSPSFLLVQVFRWRDGDRKLNRHHLYSDIRTPTHNRDPGKCVCVCVCARARACVSTISCLSVSMSVGVAQVLWMSVGCRQ